jgi:hypothetical protein
VLLQLAVQVAGHGLMLQPRSRNWLAYLGSNNYWSHGLNAGGEACDCCSENSKQRPLHPPTDRLHQQQILLQHVRSSMLLAAAHATVIY